MGISKEGAILCLTARSGRGSLTRFHMEAASSFLGRKAKGRRAGGVCARMARVLVRKEVQV